MADKEEFHPNQLTGVQLLLAYDGLCDGLVFARRNESLCNESLAFAESRRKAVRDEILRRLT